MAAATTIAVAAAAFLGASRGSGCGRLAVCSKAHKKLALKLAVQRAESFARFAGHYRDATHMVLCPNYLSQASLPAYELARSHVPDDPLSNDKREVTSRFISFAKPGGGIVNQVPGARVRTRVRVCCARAFRARCARGVAWVPRRRRTTGGTSASHARMRRLRARRKARSTEGSREGGGVEESKGGTNDRSKSRKDGTPPRPAPPLAPARKFRCSRRSTASAGGRMGSLTARSPSARATRT